MSLLWLAVLAAPVDAQREDDAFIIEAYGGIANFGRFVEQLATEGVTGIRERELSAEMGPTFGGSLGLATSVWGIEDISGQLGFQWASSEFEFDNDDPRLTQDFENAEAGSFSTYIASASFAMFFGDGDGTLAPYAIFGLNGTWWKLDADEPVGGTLGRVQSTQDGDETVFRFGATGGFGLQFRVADEIAVRLETMRHSVRSPFNGDGDRAFNISTGSKLDEPDRVSITRYSLGFVYYVEF